MAKYVLLELRGAEACAGEAEDVAGEGQQRAVLAEARVQAHAQGQEDLPELLVCHGRELLVVVKGEVLDEKRGDKAGAQGVDAEGHGPGERVSNFLLHDTSQERHSVFLETVMDLVVVLPDHVADGRDDVLEYCCCSQGAGAHKVRHHRAPERPLSLCQTHYETRPEGFQLLESW